MIGIQDSFKGFFIYYCDSYRQPRIKHDNPWQRYGRHLDLYFKNRGYLSISFGFFLLTPVLQSLPSAPHSNKVISTVHQCYRQMDGQTDGRLTVAIPAKVKSISKILVKYQYRYSKTDSIISQGIVVKHLKCGVIVNKKFIGKFTTDPVTT